MGFRKIDRGKLRRLCANVELSGIQIAKRFGVTREAIRAARNLLGIKGRGRARVAFLTQRRARREEKLRCRKFFKSRQALRRIRANATKLGIDFELLPKPHGRHMRIANAICHLIKGQFVEKAFRRRAPRVYVTLQRPTGPYSGCSQCAFEMHHKRCGALQDFLVNRICFPAESSHLLRRI